MELYEHQIQSTKAMDDLWVAKAPLIILNDVVGSGKTVTFLNFMTTKSEKCVVVTTANNVFQWEWDARMFPGLRCCIMTRANSLYDHDAQLVFATKTTVLNIITAFKPDILCFDEMVTMMTIMPRLYNPQAVIIGRRMSAHRLVLICADEDLTHNFRRPAYNELPRIIYDHYWKLYEHLPFVKALHPDKIGIEAKCCAMDSVRVKSSVNIECTILRDTYECCISGLLGAAVSFLENDMRDLVRSYNATALLNELKAKILERDPSANVDDAHMNILLLIKMRSEIHLRDLKAGNLRGGKPTAATEARIAAYEKTIDEVDKKYIEELAEDCPVCLDVKGDDPMLYICCQVLACRSCAVRLVRCPRCNLHQKPVDATPFVHEAMRLPVKRRLVGLPQVIDVILGIMKAAERTLVFTGRPSDSLVNIVQKTLPLTKLQGTAEQRRRIMANYTTGETKAIYVTNVGDICGMRFEQTSDIIVLFEPTVDEMRQIEGRGARINRRPGFPLHIHVLNI